MSREDHTELLFDCRLALIGWQKIVAELLKRIEKAVGSGQSAVAGWKNPVREELHVACPICGNETVVTLAGGKVEGGNEDAGGAG